MSVAMFDAFPLVQTVESCCCVVCQQALAHGVHASVSAHGGAVAACMTAAWLSGLGCVVHCICRFPNGWLSRLLHPAFMHLP